MVARGYTTRALVEDELGRSLTAPQQVQVDGLIEEAEALVDRVTGRAWLVASPTTETHVLVAPTVYLKRTPVASITSVTVRSSAIGAASTALVAGVGYELLDAARGLLSLSSYPLGDVVNGPAYSPGTIATVTYTYTSPLPVPKDVQGVATRMVAARMRGRLDPSSVGVKSLSVGQGDVAVTYADTTTGGTGSGASDADLAILRSYAGIVFA